MIERFTIKMAAAMSHSEVMKEFETGSGAFTQDQLAQLSKVKAKIEFVADHADMEKVRDLL
jgi:hypothetical protein